MNEESPVIRYHQAKRGKIEVIPKTPLDTAEHLSLAYTPGVAEICRVIANEPETAQILTNRSNTVAIVTDGSAILGLGNIGPTAGLPVMEGKSMIFKKMADIDAVPLCIDTQDTEEIIRFCKQIEPTFGGINLEDIAAPRCFEILDRLEKELTIPVFHDDQDGTAIVVLAGLTNAAKLRKTPLEEMSVVINGAGAAGIAIARLLNYRGVGDIILADSKGIVESSRTDLNPYKLDVAEMTNPRRLSGSLDDALRGADAFIGVSVRDILSEDHIRSMADRPIIFAMANPDPEILPESAKKAGAFIVGTGRSDYPNQINNALVFPGIFRALLDSRLKQSAYSISANLMGVKLAAAEAIASVVVPTRERLLPSVMDPSVVKTIYDALRS
ncbi:MAG: NADP-dependent malic enzyme [Candidatus Moranbacteria bacterium]|nr:NADP-dependent malic enzyme [Candidatus Moranbacteria bacterium]